MIILKGRVVQGCGHFRQRLASPSFRAAYRKATGEDLHKGTLNVKISRCIRIKVDFRILAADYDDPIPGPKQDLLFERCLINGIPACRIRPYNPLDESGGHGDDTLEIACRQEIPNVTEGKEVQIELFRDEIDLAGGQGSTD
jgi:CTP-dependent riboflavin kinase